MDNAPEPPGDGATQPARMRARAGRHIRASDPTTLLGPPTPQAPLENRIPAPLSAPAQAPTINGPLSQPAFRGLTGIGQ